MLNRFFTILTALTIILVILFVGSNETFSAEPYSVQTIYFMPTDSKDRSEWLDLDDIMKRIQSVYKNEMDRHGFPNQTFRLETDNQGDIIVHKFKGKHNKAHYGGSTLGIVKDELAANGFNDKRTIYAIVMAGMDTVQVAAGGVGGAWADGGWLGNSDYYGYCVTIESTREHTERILTHEIGHTFGLWHIALYDPQGYIMGGDEKLALHEARWLSRHHYFNKRWQFNFAPEMTKFHGAENFGEDNIRFRVNISDSDGLHQAYLTIHHSIIGWDFQEGKQNETAIFDVPRRLLLDGKSVGIYLMDNNGNWKWFIEEYTLPEKPSKEQNENKLKNKLDIEPEPEPETEIYSDYLNKGKQLWDFQEDAKGWKVANGNWFVDDGLYKVSRGDVSEHSLVGQSDWDNYTIDAKVRIDNIHWAGIVFRAKSETEYYVYYINTLDQRNQLFKHSAGDWDNREEIAWTWTVGGIQLQNDVWYDLTVEVLGNKFTCYINGKEQIVMFDNTYEAGKVGLWAWDTAASFDDFTVTRHEVKDSLSVLSEQITVLWGYIKQLD